MNAALGDARKSDVDAVFANIAEKAGVLDDAFTKEAFLADLHSWESAVKPAYTEHKIALGYGVTCRCGNQRRVDGVKLAFHAGGSGSAPRGRAAAVATGRGDVRRGRGAARGPWGPLCLTCVM